MLSLWKLAGGPEWQGMGGWLRVGCARGTSICTYFQPYILTSSLNVKEPAPQPWKVTPLHVSQNITLLEMYIRLVEVDESKS